MNKKITALLLMLSITLSLQSAYKTNQYMQVVDVKGKVKISSQKAIVKPASNGDFIFTKDNISTEKNSSLTSYLESNNIFKVKENSSLNINESYDKTGNTKLYLDRGNFLIAAFSNIKPDSIIVSTSNASIKVSGAAAVSYENGNTKVKFIYGDGEVNGKKVNQFMEADIDNSNKLLVKNIELNYDLTNTINEISSMPYIETVVPNMININDIKDYAYTKNDAIENRTTFIITNEINK
ncbi:FecR domain-containing protein [uncultured Brachyspira sp.]|uniref:FecR domain-containing protein n=1 Tax=uncultured Brachyspira sp. TaxID=221953 RepID=UPI0025DFDA33|nr:FecR domain-containing protein [uncultured Brachyspira sp.]